MIYLNNAATSFPKAPCVAGEAKNSVLSHPADDGRGTGGEDIFTSLRKSIAGLINADNPSRIVFSPNSTYALNTAISGIDLKPGDFVVTTAAEHNAVLRPLHRLSGRGINTIITPTDHSGYVYINSWERAIRTYRPKLCILNHASNVTGALNDAEEFSHIAHKYGAKILIDASQTLGQIPFDNSRINADMIAFTSHKYLLSTPGCGGLYVKDDISLSPLIYGGTGEDSDNKNMPEALPGRLEAGTGNCTAARCLLAAIQWANKNPADSNHTENLCGIITDGLLSLGCDVIKPEGKRTPVVSFNINGMYPYDAAYILSEAYGISLRTGLHCAPLIHRYIGTYPYGTIRISPGRFSTEDECREFVSAVESVMK